MHPGTGSMGNGLVIVDLGESRPSNCRYAVATVEPDPIGPGRWIRIEAEGDEVHHRVHLPRVTTTSVDDIVHVRDGDFVSGV